MQNDFVSRYHSFDFYLKFPELHLMTLGPMNPQMVIALSSSHSSCQHTTCFENIINTFSFRDTSTLANLSQFRSRFVFQNTLLSSSISLLTKWYTVVLQKSEASLYLSTISIVFDQQFQKTFVPHVSCFIYQSQAKQCSE